jgi:ribonuclease HI
MTPAAKAPAPRKLITVYTDGASRGNPGPAGIGGVILDSEGAVIEEWNDFLGTCTNNVAEYKGLLSSISRLAPLAADKVIFHLDSELIVRQLSGQYKVRDPKLKELYELARRQLTRIPSWTFRHVTRDLNARADKLANQAIDRALAAARK